MHGRKTQRGRPDLSGSDRREAGEPAGTPGRDDADVSRAARGDGAAFERLYRRHVDRIHSLARRMVGPDDADVATQDVFVRAWQKLETFRGEAAFGTWLYRLAINRLLSRRRRTGRRRDRFGGGSETLEGFSSRPDRPDLRLDFEEALEQLPDGAREIFVLYDVEGYKHREIAEMMDISTGTSKSQLHRARMLLRGHLRTTE